jgi:hypothetical protein
MRGPTLYKNVLTVIDELQGKNPKLPLSSQISFRKKKNAYGEESSNLSTAGENRLQDLPRTPHKNFFSAIRYPSRSFRLLFGFPASIHDTSKK